MKPFKTIWTWAFVMLAFVSNAQISVPNTTSINESFDVMGTGTTASLPSNWKMSPAGGGNTATWANVSNFTAVSAAASSGAPTTGGRYNWGNSSATTDRALGVMTSGSYASPNAIMAYFRNTNAAPIQTLTIGYTLERYRINTAAASVTFSYSLDGSTWTAVTAGDIASASLPTGTSAYNFNPSGAGIISLSGISISGLNIASNGDFFLRWNLNTTGGSSQGIGLDNVSLAATFAPNCTAPATQASDITFSGSSTTSLDVTWTNGDGGGRVVYMNSSNSFTAPTNGANPTASLVWSNSGQQCIFNGTGSGPITVTGLAPSTTYHFAVYEYCTPTRNYSTATGTANPNSQSTAAGAALSVNTLTAFGAQCVGGSYGPNSFNVTGVNLTTADVTIGSVSGYAFSTSATGPFTSTLSIAQPGGSFSQDVYVQFSPTAAVTYSGNIGVGGGGASNLNVAVSGSGIAAGIATLNTPTSADITTTSANLGANIASTNCSDVTVRGIEWSTTTGFANGTGTQVSETGIFGNGAYTTALTGLQANTTYYWKAFVTNAAGTTYTAQQTLVTSQEFLAVGDISILGINSNAPDNFCFVNWVDINPNMIIKFTDNGFNGTAPNSQSTAGNARSTENFVIWKNNTGSAIPAGTVIKIEYVAGPPIVVSTSLGQIVSGGLSGIASGDQIFAYQGAATSGTFPDYAANTSASTTFNGTLLYGLNLQGGSGTATWLAPSVVASSNTSYLPTELSTANAAIAIAGSATGSQYTGTRNALGTIGAYKSLVNNPANWTNVTGSTLVTINTTAFTINPNVATQIAITSVNSGVDPSQNQVFSVSVEVRDANGAPAAVGIDTDIALTLTTGSGTLSGTLTGTITAGSGNIVISGVLYNTAETGVVITAARTAGQTLTSGASAAFNVQATATYLAYNSLTDFVYTLNAVPTFTVRALRSDNSIDVNYTADVTITLTNGTGALVGTVTKPCVAGVASFNNLVFDEAGVKEITAASGTLTSAVNSALTVSTATLTEVILPQYMEGQSSGSNPNRIPFAYRVTLSGLRPTSTFRYLNAVVIAADAADNNGAGNAIYVTPSGFVRTSGTSLSTAGAYGEFTTDGAGNFTGWFITEPTGNATRFAGGTDVFPRIVLNNGLGGSLPAVRLTTSNSVRVLSLGSTATEGTALRGESGADAKNFVFAYNNIEGTGRPLSGTFVEADETDNSVANSYSSFYATSVNGVEGAYGMIIPNTLPAGVRRIEVRDLITGDLGGCASTDADGIWPSGSNTVSPTGGTIARVLSNADAPLAPSPEQCDNLIDDDCDGLVDEACPGNFANDAPGGAFLIQASVNTNYPNCVLISGDNTTANNSVESGAFEGPDSWYRFVAQSTGISITMNSSSMDDAIALYTRNGLVYTLVTSENAASGTGDFERLNYNGLTPGQTYYLSVGTSAGSGGAFSFCLQHLLPSTCATLAPAGGFNLCSTFKAAYRGASSQNVGYTFNFTPTGATAGAPTSVGPTNNLISLSSPLLALRYGGTYAASVNVLYSLTDGTGAPEPINVLGSSTGACSNVTMMQAPQSQVRLSQRCPSTLFRGSWLAGERVIATEPICGAINYTYSFRQVASCVDGTATSLDSLVFTTTSSTPYIQLGVLPSLSNTGAWNVRIRPNFNGYSGNFGPMQRIQVIGTSAAGELVNDMANADKSLEVEENNLFVYPNPSNGEFVNMALTNLEKGQLQVRVLDAAGRVVTTRVYAVEGTLQTELTFESKLSSGVYMIEMVNAGQMQMQRLVVQ